MNDDGDDDRTIKSRRMRRAEHVAQMGNRKNAYRILMGKPERKRPLGISRRRWVDNIKIVLSEIGWGGMDWIDLAQGRDQWRAVVNTVMNLRVP
jgi:glucose dehydrogenase